MAGRMDGATIAMLGLALASCGPTVADDDTGADGDSSVAASSDGGASTSTGATTTTTASGTTTVGDSSTTGAECPGEPPCRPCTDPCWIVAQCVDGRWDCGCECGASMGEGETTPPDCPTLDDALATWLDEGGARPTDCGSATLGASLATWQSVHDCVLAQAAATATFFARWDPATEDPWRVGVAARAGALYEASQWELSGFGTLVQYGCTSIVATPNCAVAVGDMCLTCEGHDMQAVLCDPG